MQTEEHFDRKKPNKRLRLRIATNRNLKFMTVVKRDATVSDLANRALSVYLELSGEARASAGSKKQLTVSAVKQGIFYMPKSELVANLLNCDDEVEVIIVKAKPKYPNQLFNNLTSRPITSNSLPIPTSITRPPSPIRQPPSPPPRCISPEVKSSKKQRKKEKLKEKRMQKKSQAVVTLQIVEQLIKEAVAVESKPSIIEKEQLAQSYPKKKVKVDREELAFSPQKLTPIVIPSPKITFHSEPKIESPRFSLLGQSIKKKFIVQAQSRKPSQDLEKKSVIDKIVSPSISMKSPLMLHKTPLPSSSNIQPEGIRSKQLENFLLPRKLSEDRQIPVKKDRNKEEAAVKRPEEQKEAKEIKQLLNVKAVEANVQKQTLKSQREPPKIVEEAKCVKNGMKLVVVEAEDSDSQENCKADHYSYPSHRLKELTEISHKINSFLIDSEEQL